MPDAPDRPPDGDQPAARPPRGRLLLAFGAATLAMVIGVALVYGLGIGGWRGGWLFALVLLPAATAWIAWLALGRHSNGRGLWTAAFTALALVLAVKAAVGAPISAPRLAARMDEVPLSGYELVSEHRAGHGWCRPGCPRITRTYLGPHIVPTSALITYIGGLRTRHLLSPPALAALTRTSRSLTAGDTHIRIMITADSVDGRAQLRVEFRARRGSQSR